MKTKALLLSLLVLVVFSCSKDDNGPVEELETINLVIKKAHFNYLNTNQATDIFFDTNGRITHIDNHVGTDVYTYEYAFNSNNTIDTKKLFLNGSQQYTIHFAYDASGKLMEISKEDSNGTNIIMEFNHNGNTVEVTYPLNPAQEPSYYTFDAHKRLIKSEVKDWEYNVQIIKDYIYSEDNLTQINTTYENCDACEDEIAVFSYDNNPNPLANDFGNKFFYFEDVEPYSAIGRFHFSSNNYLTFTPDNGAYQLQTDIEYNQNEFPVTIQEFNNQNLSCEITFEYY